VVFVTESKKALTQYILMSKMGLAGQDVLTRKYNLPTLASDNKLYTHTQTSNIAVLPKREESKEIYVLQDSDIGTFWGRHQSTLVNKYRCFL